jgi:AMP-binding enzyme/AMP-binding enzyme C-terminal domain/Phosphopantetheine attachment site
VGQPGLTAERFIQSRTGERLFRTGDMGRWLETGVLDYLGRMDRQVKIGGVRVEPGEVQVVLGACPGVTEAVVVAQPQFSGDLGLVAYVVASEVADAGEWRDYLVKRLPAALIPVTFIKISAIPLNPSGKVDFSALPRIVHLPERGTAISASVETTSRANLSQEELQICKIWADVLGTVDVRSDTDFFAHGGNSLLAIRAVSVESPAQHDD